MKTSNKLIMAVILLSVSVTLAFFLISIQKNGNGLKVNYVTKTKSVDNFSVIVALGYTEFNVEGSKLNEISWMQDPKDTCKVPVAKWFVRNDTLFVQQTTVNRKFEERLVIRSKSLRAISATQRDLIELRGFQGNVLDIRNKRSHIFINNWGVSPSANLVLNVLASDNAELDLYNTTISRLNARLDKHSECSAHERVRVGMAELNLTDNSMFAFDHTPMDLHSVIDSTSRCRIW